MLKAQTYLKIFQLFSLVGLLALSPACTAKKDKEAPSPQQEAKKERSASPKPETDENLPVPVAHADNQFGKIPRPHQDAEVDKDATPPAGNNPTPFQKPQNNGIRPKHQEVDLKQEIKNQAVRLEKYFHKNSGDPEFEIKWVGNEPHLHFVTPSHESIFVTKLFVVPAGTQFYIWTGQQTARSWDQKGSISPETIEQLVSARNPEWNQGNGLYASTNPFDSQTFGSHVSIITTQREILIAPSQPIVLDPQNRFWPANWTAKPKEETIQLWDAMNRSLRRIGIYALTDNESGDSFYGWLVLFHPEAVPLIQSSSHPWMQNTEEAFLKMIRGGVMSDSEKSQIASKMPAIIDQLLLNTRDASVPSQRQLKIINENFPGLIFRRFQIYASKHSDQGSKDALLKWFHKFRILPQEKENEVFNSTDLEKDCLIKPSKFLACGNANPEISLCSVHQNYLQLLKDINSHGIKEPKKVIDALVPRFFEPEIWQQALPHRADKNFPLHYYGVPNWVKWEKGIDHINELLASKSFDLTSIVSPSFLNDMHSTCFGDDCQIQSRFRNNEVMGQMMHKKAAASVEEIENYKQFLFPDSTGHLIQWVTWHPTPCRDAAQIGDKIFVDHGVQKQCGYVLYGPEKSVQASVNAAMSQWGLDFVKYKSEVDAGTLDPIWYAAWAQRNYVAIHPFGDGNGRTSRFIMDLILGYYGLPAPILDNMDADLGQKSNDTWACEVGKGIRNMVKALENCSHHPSDVGCKELNWSHDPNLH